MSSPLHRPPFDQAARSSRDTARFGAVNSVERFNGIYGDAVLDAWLFLTLDQIRAATEHWLTEYDLERPHISLGDIPPVEFFTQRGHAEVSTFSRPKKGEVDSRRCLGTG